MYIFKCIPDPTRSTAKAVPGESSRFIAKMSVESLEPVQQIRLVQQGSQHLLGPTDL